MSKFYGKKCQKNALLIEINMLRYCYEEEGYKPHLSTIKQGGIFMKPEEKNELLSQLFALECKLLEELPAEFLSDFNEYIDIVCRMRDCAGI